MAFRLTPNDDGLSYNLLYEAEDLQNPDIVKLLLGINWDDDGTLRKYTKDDLPDKLKRQRKNPDDEFTYRIKKTFYFAQSDLVDDQSSPEYTLCFKFAELTDMKGIKYWKVPGRILDIDRDVYFEAKYQLNKNHFVVGRNRDISVFKVIDKQIAGTKPIVICDSLPDAMPWDGFDFLLKNFPTPTMLDRYTESKISELVSEYWPQNDDYDAKFREILQKVRKRAINSYGVSASRGSLASSIQIGTAGVNACRYESLLEAKKVLDNALRFRRDLDESFWQEKILSILPAIYPQYIAVLRETTVPETISKHGKKTNRYLDHLLIEASGDVDILEVKRPFPKDNLLNKTTYRDNYVPARQLSGGISQIEKYIYYMNHLGSDGEREFSNKCKESLAAEGTKLPDDIELKVLNPHGILLIGYCEFTDDERRDFDLIRRQYAHVTDILTYNDLMERINRILAMTSPWSAQEQAKLEDTPNLS